MPSRNDEWSPSRLLIWNFACLLFVSPSSSFTFDDLRTCLAEVLHEEVGVEVDLALPLYLCINEVGEEVVVRLK